MATSTCVPKEWLHDHLLALRDNIVQMHTVWGVRMTNKQGLHSMALDRIIKSPHLIGLDGIALAAKEVKLYDGMGMTLCEPDVMFMTDPRNMHLIEYKCGVNHRSKALKQLDAASAFLRDYHHGQIHRYYVNGKFEVEKV